MPAGSAFSGDSGELRLRNPIWWGFFYLCKLLVLSLDNSVIKRCHGKRKHPLPWQTYEQWTIALTLYLSVFTDKFPMLSQELVQYFNLIRYTSRVHKGLGWAIYDYKFRQKASRNKSLVWSIFDSHLWLTIFTVPPAALIKEYPLFTKGPSSSSASFGASYEGTCINYDESWLCTRDECKYMQAHLQLMQVVIKDQNTVRRSRADRNRVATNLLLIRGPKSILFRN